MKNLSLLLLILIAVSLSGCAGKKVNPKPGCDQACIAAKETKKQALKVRCNNGIVAAWEKLDVMEAEGFAGTLSYTKALGLLTAAKAQQSVERFESCVDKVTRAKYYIDESKKGL